MLQQRRERPNRPLLNYNKRMPFQPKSITLLNKNKSMSFQPKSISLSTLSHEQLILMKNLCELKMKVINTMLIKKDCLLEVTEA